MILQGTVCGSTPFGGHLDSRWSPCGVQMDFKQNYGLKSLSDGVQMESRWIHGVHVESIWNLWGSVKYRYSSRFSDKLTFCHCYICLYPLVLLWCPSCLLHQWGPVFPFHQPHYPSDYSWPFFDMCSSCLTIVNFHMVSLKGLYSLTSQCCLCWLSSHVALTHCQSSL